MRITTAKGAALARVQAVSPSFRAPLVQPSAALRPFRFAPRMGDPPWLDSCYPGPRRSGRGIRYQRNPNFYFRKESTFMNINRVTLCGYVGKDARTNMSQNGKSVTRLSIATTKRYRDAQQQWQERTQWHDCVAYNGSVAESAA